METNKSCLPLFIVQPVIWPITHYSACNFSINTAQLAEPAERQRMRKRANARRPPPPAPDSRPCTRATAAGATRKHELANRRQENPRLKKKNVSVFSFVLLLSPSCSHVQACARKQTKQAHALYLPAHTHTIERIPCTVIASSTVIKRSNYVFKHGQCRGTNQ